MRAAEVACEMRYVAPRYRAPDGASWIHALHGSVPDHRIDFVCCPEAPQGAFTRTHLAHLARLMKYIEPRLGSPFAFAIGNLSRDDTQYEPGHGAVSLLSGMRIAGATDSAGRRDPPLAHAIVAVDRQLSFRALVEAASSLHDHAAGRRPEAFYGDYVRAMSERPEDVPGILERYFAAFPKLPALPQSALEAEFVEGATAPPRRVLVVHEVGEPFGRIVYVAAKIAALLYRSRLRWTSIVFGGVVDIPGGLSVELVTSLPADVGPSDRVLRLGDVPEDEEAIARDLFGASRLAQRIAWRPRAGREGAVAWAAREGAPMPAREDAAATANSDWDDDAPTLVRSPRAASSRVQEIAVGVDRDWLVDPGVAVPPASPIGVAGGHDASPALKGPPAQKGGVERTRRARRWLRVSALGAAVVLALTLLLTARGRKGPAADTASPAADPLAVDAPSAPASASAPMAADGEQEEAPGKVEASAPAEAPGKVEASAPEDASRPVRRRVNAPVAKPDTGRRVIGRPQALWLKEADSGRR